MEKRYRDCYVTWGDTGFAIGNSAVERSYALLGNSLVPTALVNKASGYTWGGREGAVIVNEAEYSRPDFQGLTFHAATGDNGGLSETFLALTATFAYESGTVVKTYAVFPESPFVSTAGLVKGSLFQARGDGPSQADWNGVENSYQPAREEGLLLSARDAVDIVPLSGRHLRVNAVKLYDKTDQYDTLLTEERRLLYARETFRTRGNLLFLEDYVAAEALLIVKEAPTHLSALARPAADFVVHGNRYAELIGTGLGQGGYGDFVHSYGSLCGVGDGARLISLYKAHYQKEYRGGGQLFIMSNTWGDRNQDAAVNRDFILEELAAARELGVDVMQIDDGWQQGVTANSKLAAGGVWEGYYRHSDDFWAVNSAKFPRGFREITDAARSGGIRLGLWFSPDSTDDLANWRRDADTLLGLHREYGVEFFKLDGLKIRSKEGERNYLRFLEALSRESGNRISVNQDITAEDRLGYLYHKQYGTVFVENRYTDWGNYYPHNTLKNLWTLSRYFPAGKFQFEVLNNRRNPHLYEGDPFAPALYTIDYAFACVMVSNPLLWMEMTGLSRESRGRLRDIIRVYREHRDAFWGAEVLPIGEMPDGRSFTGFQVACGPEEGYLILFREDTAAEEAVYRLQVPAGSRLHTELLWANREPEAFTLSGDPVAGNGYAARCIRPRSYAFLKYRVL